MQRRRAADDDLEHVLIGLALHAERCLERGGSDRAGRCDVAWKGYDRRWIGGTGLTDLVVDLLHSSRERSSLAMATDTHSVDFRIVEEEVIVERRHLEACVECGIHDRIRLVLEDAALTHHCPLRVDRCSREGGPRGEAHERRHLPVIDGNFHVGAGRGNFEDAFLGIELAFETGEFLDARGVEFEFGSVALSENR